MWRWVRQGTGQVVEGVQEGRLEDCEGGALVGVGGDVVEDDDGEWVEEEEGHSGPPEALQDEEDGVAPGNSCGTHRNSRAQNAGNRDLELQQTSKRLQEGGWGSDYWAGGVQEDKSQDQGVEVDDGEGLQLEDEQEQDGHCGEEDVELVHGEVGVDVELDGVASHAHGGEDEESCDGEVHVGRGRRGGVGGGEHGWHATGHDGEAGEDQEVPQSTLLARRDKDQPPLQPVG